MADSAGLFDEQVHRRGGAVGGTVGVEVGEQLAAPGPQRATEPGDLADGAGMGQVGSDSSSCSASARPAAGGRGRGRSRGVVSRCAGAMVTSSRGSPACRAASMRARCGGGPRRGPGCQAVRRDKASSARRASGRAPCSAFDWGPDAPLSAPICSTPIWRCSTKVGSIASHDATRGRHRPQPGDITLIDHCEQLLTAALGECRRIVRPGGRVSMVFGNSSGKYGRSCSARSRQPGSRSTRSTSSSWAKVSAR